MKAKKSKRFPMRLSGGPFDSQMVYMESSGTLPIQVGPWIGRYIGVQWQGNNVPGWFPVPRGGDQQDD